MDCNPSSCVCGILQARIWSGLLFSSPGDLPYPGTEPASLALAGGFFPSEPPGKPLSTSTLITALFHAGEMGNRART